MVSIAVDAINHRVGCSLELVGETARNQPPDDRPSRVPVSECEISHAAFDALIGQSAVDSPDDVVALAQRPHSWLCVLRQAPSCRTERLREAEALQFLHAADHGGASVSIRLDVGAGPKVYDAIMLRSIAVERAIERGPPIGFDLSVQIATDLEIGSRSELERGEMRSAGAQSVADVVAGNDEIAAMVGLAPYDDMDMRVVRIPMIG